MEHNQPKQRKHMTTTHYQSNDEIVKVLITTDDHRYPRHDAPMAILKLQPQPQPHSRCREQWGAITAMLNHADLRGILEAFAKCDKGFHYTLSKTAQPKPASRKQAWDARNRKRVTGYKQ
jgi:hypothetical protein